MLNRKLVGTFIFMVFAIGWANGAELFANYNGESIGVVRDNDGKTNFLQTIDGAIFPILGKNVKVDPEIIENEVLKQEEQIKRGTDKEQFFKVIRQLSQIKIGLDHYKHEASQPGSNSEQAMKNSWDFATSSGVSTGLERAYFVRTVESAARSEKDYNSFVSMIPENLDDAIAKSRKGWKRDALKKAALAKLTENITLDEKDLNILASGRLDNDPAYRQVQTTDTLLSVKKGYMLRKQTVDRLLKKDVITSPELKSELAIWWKAENEKYLKEFPQWGE